MVKIPKVQSPYASKEHRAFPSNDEVPKMDEVPQIGSHRGHVLVWEEGDEKYTLRTNGAIVAEGGRFVGKLTGGTDLEEFVAKIFQQKKVVHYLNHHYRRALVMKERPYWPC